MSKCVDKRPSSFNTLTNNSFASSQGVYESTVAQSFYSSISMLANSVPTQLVIAFPPQSFLFSSALLTTINGDPQPLANIKRQACTQTTPASTAEATPTDTAAPAPSVTDTSSSAPNAPVTTTSTSASRTCHIHAIETIDRSEDENSKTFHLWVSESSILAIQAQRSQV